MSTIHVIPQAAGRAEEALRAEYEKGLQVPEAGQPHNSDQDMMFAWSIDTAHPTAANVPAAHEESESCPPEVYIG